MVALCVKILYFIKNLKIKLTYLFEKNKYYLLKKDHYKDIKDNYDEAYKIVSGVRDKKENKVKKVNLECKKDLSIIIPVYNSEKYIKSCINSIISQNIKYNIEIICIDDGSTDKSLELIKTIKDDRLKIYTQKNSGAASARNKGLNMATGRYIMFVDSDDFITKDAINKLLDVAYQKNADIVSGNIQKYIEKFDLLISLKTHKKVETDDLLKMCNNSEGAPWGKIYKKELWNYVRFHEGYAFEDCIIFLNIYPTVKKYINIEDNVYCFRSSNSSLFKRSLKDSTCIDSFWGILTAYEMILNKKQMSNKYIQLFIWHLSAIMYERIKNLSSYNLKKSIVILSKQLIFKILDDNKVKTNIFEGPNKYLYIELIRVLKIGDYKEWERICKIILLSEKI